MRKHLCIHGHFYQPPREDPWLGAILPEGSAAPSLNWNQRITGESYAPLARARRLDGSGRITGLLNCYEWMSFNAGPTLLSWMAGAYPDTVRLMQEADAASIRRLGKGNAMAQVYHHQILPLASELDKELEVAWAVDDFTARFGRAPEGMWLAETAVDTASLEALARHGVRFTVLAPGQAKAVAALEHPEWKPVDASSLDIGQPYLVKLPSGRSVSVFFYDGPLSQAVAFEGLLADGENFWRRLSGACSPGLLALATDGETYGHHFKFGEMALAFVLDQGRQERDGVALTNFAAYLEANPPAMQVRLHEPSAWSCAHGVERWRSNCGCTTGEHPGWHQRWRGPLRQALQGVKDAADAHFFQRGAECFKDPRSALVAYGKVLAGLMSQEGFAKAQFRSGLPAAQQATAWRLLSMQQWGLASLASCAWFFDEVSRIEPVNALTFALRSMELARHTGGPDMEPELLPILRQAESNLPEYGNAEVIWRTMVAPRRESEASLAAQALLTLHLEERFPEPERGACVTWPGVGVEVAAQSPSSGTARISWALESGADEARWEWRRPSGGEDPLLRPLSVEGALGPEEFLPAVLPVNKRQALADAWALHASEKAWECALASMNQGAHLVAELQEAQTTLTLAPLWAGMWQQLAWAYLWGLDLSPKQGDLLRVFLAQASGSGWERDGLMERVRRRTLQEICTGLPDWEALCRMVLRVRELNLPENWWEAQNALWEGSLHAGAGSAFAQLIGFA